MRGTLLRAETKTNVDLISCLFEANSSSNIGSIFNRGRMAVKGCIFKNNSGKVSRARCMIKNASCFIKIQMA